MRADLHSAPEQVAYGIRNTLEQQAIEAEIKNYLHIDPPRAPDSNAQTGAGTSASEQPNTHDATEIRNTLDSAYFSGLMQAARPNST